MHPSEIRQVPLAHLRDGSDYPLGNINMRKGPKGDLGPLKASLRECGQLQNMVGSTYQGGDEVYLLIGNRRREAAQANQDDSPRVSLNRMDVRVYADLTVEQAMEIALHEKIPELPPHEVDQYEAFAALEKTDPEEIAAHFDCPVRLVRQRMKLGALSPKVRDAYREGLMDRPAFYAFTMGRDHKTQNKAYDKLLRTHSLNARAVRAMLLPDQQDVARLLFFASAEYVQAGGEVIVDLFEDEHGASDPALLKQVADQVLADRAKAYVTEHGFAWASVAADLPDEWEGWPRMRLKEAEPRPADAARLDELAGILGQDDSTPEERRAARVEKRRIVNDLILATIPEKKRKTMGVVARIDSDGGLDVIMGITRPEAPEPRVLQSQTGDSDPPPPREPERAGGKAPDEAPPRLSHKAQSQRAVELTTAAARVLEGCPELALIILVAGFANRGGYGPIRARVEGLDADALRLMESDSIADNIPRLKTMKPAALLKLAAKAAAGAIVFHAHNAERAAIEDDDVRAVVGLLPADRMAKALASYFDPADYFGKSLPRELALESIRENCGQAVYEDQRDDITGTAAGIRAFAQANIKADWLPPALRFPGYAGPGAKKGKAGTRAKKKPAAKKKR